MRAAVVDAILGWLLPSASEGAFYRCTLWLILSQELLSRKRVPDRRLKKINPIVGGFVGLNSAVRAGLGAAVLPFFVTGADPDLVCVQRDGVPPRDLWLVVHEDVRRSPRVRAVMDVLIEILGRERAFLEGSTV
jgi:DNA-binding transcriptional LysR family regulator